MAELSSPAPSGLYRLVAVKLSASPVILKAIIEAWCVLNCTGAWEAKIGSRNIPVDVGTTVELDLHADGDVMLFMLSPEYGYMGKPPLTTLTNQ